MIPIVANLKPGYSESNANSFVSRQSSSQNCVCIKSEDNDDCKCEECQGKEFVIGKSEGDIKVEVVKDEPSELASVDIGSLKIPNHTPEYVPWFYGDEELDHSDSSSESKCA